MNLKVVVFLLVLVIVMFVFSLEPQEVRLAKETAKGMAVPGILTFLG